MAAPPLATVRLTKKIEVTHDLAILRFEPEPGGPLTYAEGRWNFQPGQFVTLGLPGPEKQVERAYSVASSPYDSYLEFFIEVVPNGQLTPRMRDLKAGDRMSCRKAAGRFLVDPACGRHVQAATVTGVAPFVSVLKTHSRDLAAGKGRGDLRFLLVYAASHAAELAYRDELERFREEGFLTFVPSVSRPWENPGWTGETGRCEEILRKHMDAAGFTAENACAYLCGNGDMVRNAEGVLRRARFAQERIKKEEYW